MYNALIVDDEPAVREGLSIMIDWNACGFQVLDTARNGRDALDKLETDPYDLVITDVRMPVLGGIELVQEIRKRKPDMIVMIISGYGEFAYAQRAIEYGVRAYLLKPVKRDDLMMNILHARMELDRRYQESERAGSTIPARKYPGVIGDVLEYIDANLAGDLSLKSIADMFYINPAYLGQLFKKSMGETFSRYLNRKRVSEAKKLLLEEKAGVQEIMEKVGYRDSDYFYKQFKRYENISFSEYKSHTGGK